MTESHLPPTERGTDDRSGPADVDQADAGVMSGAPIARAGLKSNVAHLALSQVATWSMAIVLMIVIPRFLGPAQVGHGALAESVWAIVVVLAPLGTSMFLQLSIARDQRSGLSLLGRVTNVRLGGFGLAFVAVGVYAAVAGPSAWFLAVLMLAGVHALVTSLTELVGSVFIGLERMRSIAVVAVVSRLALVVLVVSVLLAGSDLIGVLLASIAAAGLGLTIAVRRLRRLGPRTGGVVSTPYRRIVTSSVPYMVAALALITYQKVDTFMVASLTDARTLGWYSSAELLTGSLLFPTTIVVGAMLPVFARLYHSDRSEFEGLVRRVFSLLFLAAVPIGLGAMAVAPTFATTLLGSEFAEAGRVVAITSVMTMFTFGATLFASVALATGRERLVAGLLFVAAGLTVPLDLLLVPWAVRRYDNGAIGGGVAYVLTEALQFVVLLVVVAPFVMTRTVLSKALRVLLAGAGMAIAIWPLREMFVAVPAAVGAAVYLLLVVVFRALDRSELTMIRQVRDRFQ